MKVSEDWNRRLVETDEATETKKLGRAKTVEPSEGQTAVLGGNVKLRPTKPCVSETDMDSRQTWNEA